MKIVYVNLTSKFNFGGSEYEFGELVVGVEDESRVLAAYKNGKLLPVVLESLPADVQKAYTDALSAAAEAAVSAPETAPAESEPEAAETPQEATSEDSEDAPSEKPRTTRRSTKTA